MAVEDFVILILGHSFKYLVPCRSRFLSVADKYAVGMKLEIDLTCNAAVLKQHLGYTNTLRITDLDDLGFHNYIVITSKLIVNIKISESFLPQMNAKNSDQKSYIQTANFICVICVICGEYSQGVN